MLLIMILFYIEKVRKDFILYNRAMTKNYAGFIQQIIVWQLKIIFSHTFDGMMKSRL